MKAEAAMLVAKQLLAMDDLEGAYTKFKSVSTTSVNALGAEAKYHMAYVRHLQGQYRKAEAEVVDLAKKFPAYDHWKARGFILLGDVYVQLDDRFQAKATLQSVIDHCQEPDLVAQAQQRLDGINASEVQRDAPPSQEELTIPLPGGPNGQ